MGIDHFLTFFITALLFIMTPGIDTVFVLNKSIGQGKKAGIYSALGINTGVLVHTLFAALGLSLIIARSTMAFEILKYAGAAYLIYLGIAKILSKKMMVNNNPDNKTENSGRKNFLSGIFTNALNPKVALFFLAFFPQFINRDSLNSPVPFIILGLNYAAIGVTWFSILALFSSTFCKKLINNPKTGKLLNKFSGIAFILMGFKVAFTKR